VLHLLRTCRQYWDLVGEKRPLNRPHPSLQRDVVFYRYVRGRDATMDYKILSSFIFSHLSLTSKNAHCKQITLGCKVFTILAGRTLAIPYPYSPHSLARWVVLSSVPAQVLDPAAEELEMVD